MRNGDYVAVPKDDALWVAEIRRSEGLQASLALVQEEATECRAEADAATARATVAEACAAECKALAEKWEKECAEAKRLCAAECERRAKAELSEANLKADLKVANAKAATEEMLRIAAEGTPKKGAATVVQAAPLSYEVDLQRNGEGTLRKLVLTPRKAN